MPAAERAVTAFAPGRVNLIGEHTDYNDGLCLPFAIERGVTVTATAAGGTAIEVRARDLGESDRIEPRGQAAGNDGVGWRAFARGVVGELRRAGVELPGARLDISGDLPRGAGLGSSAALSVSLCLALLELAGESTSLNRMALALLCARVENDWVGVPSGLLDQLAVLFGEPGRALRLDMRSALVEPVGLDLGGWRLALLDSGARRKLAGSGYEERRAECERACRELGVASLRDARVEDVATLPAPLDARARHVLCENDRVEATIEAVTASDFERLGTLLNASHASLRDDFDVSVPEVEATIERAAHAGARGARIHGGGFGGQVLALFGPATGLPDDATPVAPSAGAPPARARD